MYSPHFRTPIAAGKFNRYDIVDVDRLTYMTAHSDKNVARSSSGSPNKADGTLDVPNDPLRSPFSHQLRQLVLQTIRYNLVSYYAELYYDMQQMGACIARLPDWPRWQKSV
jgi:hypothetical protein